MRTKNSMQLKALIKRKAREMGVSPQAMLQDYMLERLIVRVAHSPWGDCLIVKGGVLVGSLIGLDRRTTKDLDTTATGFCLSEETISRVFEDICSTEVDDDLTFEIVKVARIREGDEYPGVRVSLQARYEPLDVPLAVDVTTGDRITPSAMSYDFPLIFDEGFVRIMAYPMETVLAEKLETILARGIASTRPRDFYDVYELWKLRGCDARGLRPALVATCERRGSTGALDRAEGTIDEIRRSEALRVTWENYARRYAYAESISYPEVCDVLSEVLRACGVLG